MRESILENVNTSYVIYFLFAFKLTRRAKRTAQNSHTSGWFQDQKAIHIFPLSICSSHLFLMTVSVTPFKWIISHLAAQ